MDNFMKLSRAEMKDVTGGLYGGGPTEPGEPGDSGNNPSCKIGECELYVEALHKVQKGTCSAKKSDNYSWQCICSAGSYSTNNGGTSCVL